MRKTESKTCYGCKGLLPTEGAVRFEVDGEVRLFCNDGCVKAAQTRRIGGVDPGEAPTERKIETGRPPGDVDMIAIPRKQLEHLLACYASAIYLFEHQQLRDDLAWRKHLDDVWGEGVALLSAAPKSAGGA